MRVLGIDIGGSGTKGALVDVRNGTLATARIRYATPQPATPKAVARTVADIAADFKWKGPIGIGFPAAIQENRATTASNVTNSWIGKEVVKLFSKATGCSVAVVNDADAAALAELQYGHKSMTKGTVVFLTVGTGIGTAIITNGHLVPNTELGHLVMNKIGDAERFCSDAARKRSHLTWESWALRFKEYIEYLEFLLHPDLFVLGGGVSKKLDRFEEYFKIKTRYRIASLKNEAGIVGAAWAASKLPGCKT